METKAKRLNGIDFIRAVCSLGIVLYHFSAASACPHKILFGNANGNWGEAFVALFFIISGYSLFYNHREVSDIREFYKKRLKSIFPSFWIGYAIVFFIRVIKNGALFFLDGTASRWTIVLSVIGMDGYFLYKIPDYYLIGEWFLGAIIILYLIYPLLVKIFTRFGEISAVILAAVYIYIVYYNPFVIEPFRNILSCLLFFIIGMLFCKYSEKLSDNKTAILISLGMAVVMAFIRLPLKENIGKAVLGISLFLPFNFTGNLICRNNIINKIINKGSSVSYEVFLLHHVILYKILETANPFSGKKMLVVLSATVILIYISAALLKTLKSGILYFRFDKFPQYKDRNTALDIAKGLGIIAVMLVHIPRDFRFVADGWTFHLAVFFAVSGILTVNKKYDLKKDFIRLLVPYFLLSILYIAFVSIRYYCHGQPEMIAGDAKVYMFYTLSFIGCGTLWFLPALFFSRLINAGLKYIAPDNSTLIQLFLLVAGSFAAWILTKNGISGYPQALSATAYLHNVILAGLQAVIAAGISGLGIVIWNFINKNTSFKWILSLTLISAVLNLLLFKYYDGNNLNYAYIINPWGFILGLIPGLTAILGLSLILSKVPYVSSFFVYFGINSIIIMTTHLEYGFVENAVLFTQAVSGNSLISRILPVIILCIIEWMICLVVNATPLINIFKPYKNTGHVISNK